MKHYIKGTYRKSIFQSSQGYVIGIFKVRETDDESLKDYINKTITFTGYFHELTEEDHYIFYGEGVDHPKYGFQFQVSGYEKVKPEDKDGVIAFLSSDLFPGIGEKQATLIVETLGEKALDKILEDASCLSLVPKLSSKKAKKVYDTLVKYEESHKTIVYLTELGFSMKDALHIYNTYKSFTIETLEHNIYRVMNEVDDISFLKLDAIALSQGMEKEDERRVKAGILYTIQSLTFQTGNTYFSKQELYQETCKNLKQPLEENLFTSQFQELIDEEEIVEEEDRYYEKEMYQCEVEVADQIQFLCHLPQIKYKKMKKVLEEYEQSCGVVYNEKQKEAIIQALTNHCSIITGGPGTGKTTIVKALIELYQKLN